MVLVVASQYHYSLVRLPSVEVPLQKDRIRRAQPPLKILKKLAEAEVVRKPITRLTAKEVLAPKKSKAMSSSVSVSALTPLVKKLPDQKENGWSMAEDPSSPIEVERAATITMVSLS